MANDQIVRFNPTPSSLTNSAGVGDEINRAGISFGTLIQTTGMAVGKTQLRLNQTGAATATVLATTPVDVIAVQESIYNDQGNLIEAKSHTRKLPLINFMDPVFYEWTEVRLRGEFFANEFVSSNEASSSSTSTSNAQVNAGLSIFLGPGARSGKSKSTSNSSDRDTSLDTSYGRIRASALLSPKRDVGVPKPRQVLRGPSLSVLAGTITAVMDGQTLVGRTMSAIIELRRMNGTPIEGKGLSIETEGVPWQYASEDADKTDSLGQVAIVLTRTFLGEKPDTSAINIAVTVRLGLVSSSTTLTF
jgi:hypothetical protein